MWLFCERGAEDVAAGVTAQEEGAGIVGDVVVVGENQDRGERTVASMAGVKRNLAPCLSKTMRGRRRVETFPVLFLVVANSANERAALFQVRRHRHLRESSDLVGVRANAGGGDRMPQEVGFGGANSCLRGGALKGLETKTLEEGSVVGGVGCGVQIADVDVVKVQAATRSIPGH